MYTKLFFLICAILISVSCKIKKKESGSKQPDIIFILADDLGYGDLGCYGATTIATPNIDKIRDEGMKFTSFYVCNRCSPSRMSLMTGSYSIRAGIDKVIYRRDRIGISANEITVAELLKKAGYTTGIVGKWHLGEWGKFNPVNHGFDSFYGFMEYGGDKGSNRRTGIYRNKELVEKDVKRTDGKNSPKLLKAGIDFITENKDRPFFLYYASPLPHTPWLPMERFKGTSKLGTYGDVVQELDWQVGELMKTVDELGLASNTLVVFASDNGPVLGIGGGSAGPLRDGKWTNFEGGIRVPCIMRWPETITSGSANHEITGIIDMLPTFCSMAGVDVPDDRVIDGRNILPYMKGEKVDTPIHDLFIAPGSTIRYGDWKLFVKDQKPGGQKRRWGTRVPAKAGSLFNLKTDIGESTNISAQHPDQVKKLTEKMSRCMTELNAHSRPVGKTNDYDINLIKADKARRQAAKKAGKTKKEDYD